MWWRRKKAKTENADRDYLRNQDRENLIFIKANWPPQNQFLLSVTVANDWRMFLDSVGTVEFFLKMPRVEQMQYLQRYLLYAANQKMEADKLRSQSPDKSFESLCEHFSSRFMSSYLICLIENNSQWEVELAPKLDDFLKQGWSMSLGVMPLPNEADKFQNNDPSLPHTYFVRDKEL